MRRRLACLLSALLACGAGAAAAPAPAPDNGKAARYQRMLLERKWWQGNIPAAQLPSDWTRCETRDGAVHCASSPAVHAAGGEQRRYAVRTRLDGFDAHGRFKLHLDADVRQTAPPQADVGKGTQLGWTAQEVWDCLYQGWEVNCAVNGKHLVQFTHQPLQTMGNGGLTVSPPPIQ